MHFWKTGAALLSMTLIGGTALHAQSSARPPMRFEDMDRNGDGRITRSEWRGSSRSFAVVDRNHDGVLSREEIRIDDGRETRSLDSIDFDSAAREYEFDDWTVRGFTALDHNRDNRITADEWHFNREAFRRADQNRDGVLTRAEFLNDTNAADNVRDRRFGNLDENGDGRISRAEWRGTAERFDALDDDRNGYLTANEMNGGNEPPADLFSSVDINRDGTVARSEWHWSHSSFNERDLNHDGRLSRAEFTGNEAPITRSQAYRTGYERGVIEGRQAGREDGARNTWDLDGQRELEQADSGYQAGVGPRAEYQAGYREGFRIAYREGFGR